MRNAVELMRDIVARNKSLQLLISIHRLWLEIAGSAYAYSSPVHLRFVGSSNIIIVVAVLSSACTLFRYHQDGISGKLMVLFSIDQVLIRINHVTCIGNRITCKNNNTVCRSVGDNVIHNAAYDNIASDNLKRALHNLHNAIVNRDYSR